MEANQSFGSTKVVIDERAPPWYLPTVQRLARTEFRDRFEALPTVQSLKFESQIVENKDCEGRGSWPKDAVTTVLVVGEFDTETAETNPQVYAFVHGEKRNQVGYFYRYHSNIVRLQPGGHISRVDWEEPFCDLGDIRTSSGGVCDMIRALVLYYFLVAGHIREIGCYRQFWNVFKRACGWVANKGKRPKPQTQGTAPAGRRGVSQDLVAPSSSAMPSEVPGRENAVKKKKKLLASPKRDRDEDFELESPEPKRANNDRVITRSEIITPSTAKSEQDVKDSETLLQASETDKAKLKLRNDAPSTDYSLLHMRYNKLAAEKAQLQTQNDELIAENTQLQQLRDYTRNAYDGLKQKYDQNIAVCNTSTARAVEAETLANNYQAELATWRTRAKEAEAGNLDLQGDLAQLRTTMANHLRGLDDKYGAVNEQEGV